MIEIEDVDVYGWQAAIRGMRNSWNSWEDSDSFFHVGAMPGKPTCAEIGQNDLALTKKLAAAGSDERKFMRMITVTADVIAPLYWWKEYDTYKIGTVANSCSTMHTVCKKEFSITDFSREHLFSLGYQHYNVLDTEETERIEFQTASLEILRVIIQALNNYGKLYFETHDKKYCWQIIQLLPSSYNQRRTVQLNYEVLLKIYRARKNHKLDEWKTFCSWIETLPYMSEFLGGE